MSMTFLWYCAKECMKEYALERLYRSLCSSVCFVWHCLHTLCFVLQSLICKRWLPVLWSYYVIVYFLPTHSTLFPTRSFDFACLSSSRSASHFYSSSEQVKHPYYCFSITGTPARMHCIHARSWKRLLVVVCVSNLWFYLCFWYIIVQLYA